MGPYPRMLKDCCLNPEHWIRDDEDKRIDMLLVAELFTEHMLRAANLPENFGFVSFKDIFRADKFGPDHLVDHIHLTDTAQEIVADYIMQWLDKSSVPLPGKAGDGSSLVPFSDVLQGEGLYVNGEYDEEEDEEEEEEGGEEGADDVFTSSAEAALEELRQAKEAIAKANSSGMDTSEASGSGSGSSNSSAPPSTSAEHADNANTNQTT